MAARKTITVPNAFFPITTPPCIIGIVYEKTCASWVFYPRQPIPTISTFEIDHATIFEAFIAIISQQFPYLIIPPRSLNKPNQHLHILALIRFRLYFSSACEVFIFEASKIL